MKFRELFILNWKRFLIVFVVWVAAVVLHNAISVLIGSEEALFFIIAIFILPGYLIAAVIYSLIQKYTKS